MDTSKEDLLALDVNDSVLNVPCAQSTPKKRHHNGKALPPDQAGQLDLSLNVSDVSFTNLRTIQSSIEPKFKKPKNVKPKRAPKFICTYCSKGYICERSFKTHIMQHRVQDAQSRYPDRNSILSSMNSIAKEAYHRTALAFSFGQVGTVYTKCVEAIGEDLDSEQWAEFCCVLSEKILNCAVGQKFLLPSKLIGVFLQQVESTLTDRNFCSTLNNILPVSSDYPSDILDKFLLQFTLNLVKDILKFISIAICALNNQQTPRPKPVLDDEDREVIFYIGGSILRGYLRSAGRFPHNQMWKSIVSTIRGKMLVEESENNAAAKWTVSVDRGGLLYISVACQEFFVSVTEIIFSQQKDGSIDYEKVLGIVSSSNVCVLWDNIVFDSLPENMSVSLMNDVIKCMCQTCGKGFAKRRLNALRSRPLVSMPTRHLVATRKK